MLKSKYDDVYLEALRQKLSADSVNSPEVDVNDELMSDYLHGADQDQSMSNPERDYMLKALEEIRNNPNSVDYQPLPQKGEAPIDIGPGGFGVPIDALPPSPKEEKAPVDNGERYKGKIEFKRTGEKWKPGQKQIYKRKQKK